MNFHENSNENILRLKLSRFFIKISKINFTIEIFRFFRFRFFRRSSKVLEFSIRFRSKKIIYFQISKFKDHENIKISGFSNLG